MSVCCGGIVGMGETARRRAGLLHALATLPEHPQSLPINALVPIAGRRWATARRWMGWSSCAPSPSRGSLCPKSVVRLSAGRDGMSRELQALCFLAGANSMFVGGKLLTTPLPGADEDASLLADLGMRPMQPARDLSLAS